MVLLALLPGGADLEHEFDECFERSRRLPHSCYEDARPYVRIELTETFRQRCISFGFDPSFELTQHGAGVIQLRASAFNVLLANRFCAALQIANQRVVESNHQPERIRGIDCGGTVRELCSSMHGLSVVRVVAEFGL